MNPTLISYLSFALFSAHAVSYTTAFALRQRMLNFVLSLQYYIMEEVVGPHWHTLMAKIRQVSLFFSPPATLTS
jgi:hypothetical protein